MATLTNTLTVPAPVVGAEDIESLVAAFLEQHADRNNNNAPNIYEFAAANGSKPLQRLTSCPSDGSGRRVNGACPVLPVGNSNGIGAHQVLALIAAAASGVSTPSPAIMSSTTPLTDSFDALQLARQRRPLDRSASEPIPQTASSLAAAAFLLDQQNATGNGLIGMNSAAFCRYKTELCRPFEENGTCKYGDKCQFAHGRAELRPIVRHPKYKTDLCRTYHTTGLCPYGPRCHFIHNDEERRLNEVNRTIIEQQRATLMQVQQQQQQEMVASTLLTQQRLQQALCQQQQQQVEQVIASSLQRSLSLGSGSIRPTKADLFCLSAAAPIGLLGNVSGSIDSGMSSAESPSSPTSSLATSPTMSSSGSSSVSEVETGSIPFQTKQPAVIADVRLHRKQQRHLCGSASPVAPMQGVPEVLSTDLHPLVNRPQHKPLSNETAISATLLTRRLRDAATNPTASEVELKFNQLLAAATRNGCVPNAPISGSLDVASSTSLPNVISDGNGRCSSDAMAAASVGINGYPRWQGTTRYHNTTPL